MYEIGKCPKHSGAIGEIPEISKFYKSETATLSPLVRNLRELGDPKK